MASPATIPTSNYHLNSYYSAAMATSASASSSNRYMPYPSPNGPLLAPSNSNLGYHSPLSSPGAYSNFSTSHFDYPWMVGHEIKPQISPMEQAFYGNASNSSGGSKNDQKSMYGLSSASSSTSNETTPQKSKTRKSGGRRYKTPSPQILRMRRQAANARERKRMNNLNSAFEELRTVLPAMDNGKRLSKYETLQMAQHYIDCLSDLLSKH